MRTLVLYDDPAQTHGSDDGYEEDLVAEKGLKGGENRSLDVPGKTFPENFRIQRIDMNTLCRDGRMANVVTVRPLSTLN